MNVQVKKWGNSAAVRIPARTLAAAGLRVDDTVEVREEDGRIVISRARPPGLTLDAILARITDDNIHAEINLGDPVGREEW